MNIENSNIASDCLIRGGGRSVTLLGSYQRRRSARRHGGLLEFAGSLQPTALKPGGVFGLVCFKPEGGSGLSDDEVYAKGTLGGGLGYTEEQLRQIWSSLLHIESLRAMREPAADEALFGKDFLWAMLARKT